MTKGKITMIDGTASIGSRRVIDGEETIFSGDCIDLSNAFEMFIPYLNCEADDLRRGIQILTEELCRRTQLPTYTDKS